jgi:hypothetical protein
VEVSHVGGHDGIYKSAVQCGVGGLSLRVA